MSHRKIDSRAIALMLRCAAGLFFWTVAVKAQHGTVANGYFPMGYEGDTWTGMVTTTDDATRAVNLTYSSKKEDGDV